MSTNSYSGEAQSPGLAARERSEAAFGGKPHSRRTWVTLIIFLFLFALIGGPFLTVVFKSMKMKDAQYDYSAQRDSRQR